MSSFDFQNDFQNDAARKNYEAAMSGETRKGVEYFEKPHLWDEERPCDIKDTPIQNFVPIPTMDSGGHFAGYSLGKKIAVIAGVAVAAVIVIVCAVGFFMDGGAKANLDIGAYPFW